VCTYKADVGGPVAWKVGTTDKDACWDVDYAEGAGGGNGWVVGTNTYSGDQADVRRAADDECGCKPDGTLALCR